VLRGAGHGKEADLWAVGVLLFELLAGYPAFCADEPIKVYGLVLNASPSVPKSFPCGAVCASNPCRRPSRWEPPPSRTLTLFTDEVRRRRAKELIALLLRAQPHTRLGAMRGGAVDVACHSFFDAIDWIGLLGRSVEAPLIPVLAGLNMTEPEELAKLQGELARAMQGGSKAGSVPP